MLFLVGKLGRLRNALFDNRNYGIYGGKGKKFCRKLLAGGAAKHTQPWYDYMYCSDSGRAERIAKCFVVYQNFISQEEEEILMNEIQPAFKRIRYEFSHWDDAIHGFRETEKSKWSEDCQHVMKRVKEFAFDNQTKILPYVHILDLAENGYIKPHVDSVKFCGNTIAGLSLLSASVMRLKLEGKPDDVPIDIVLSPRSLYIMKDSARYDYTHEILKDDESYWKDIRIHRSRRISVIQRNEAEPHS